MKLRARIFTIIMAVAMIMSMMVISTSAAVAEPTLTVTTDSATVTPGGEVVVKVNMANNPGIVSMRLQLNYDSDIFTIVPIDEENGVIVEDKGILGTAVHNNSAAKCPYILSWQNGDADQNFTVNGDLVFVTFQVSDEAVIGESYDFSLDYDYDNTDIMDFDLEKVFFETVAASVTVEASTEPDPNAPALYIADVKGAAGDEINVTVALKNNPGLFMMNIEVDYDADALEFISAASASDEFAITPNNNENIYLLTAEGDISGDSNILTLTFNVRDGVEDGEYEITATSLEACNYAEHELTFTKATGKVIVVNFIPGDVNGDGSITLLDVARLKKYIAKISGTTIHGNASDVNNDGKVTLLDLARLKKFVAKIEGTELIKSTADLPNIMVIE